MTWQTKKLGEVCEIVKDTPSKFEGEKDYFSTGAISNGGFFVSEKVNYKNRPSRANSYPKMGDVGFAKMKFTNKTLLVDSTLQGSIFSTGFCFLRPSKLLDNKYLFHFIISDEFQKIKDLYAGDGIMGGVKNSDVKEIEITLPELSEQQRIVKILDEIFEKVEKAKEIAEKNLQNSRELFESYLQSIFANPNDEWEEKKLGDKNLLKIIDGDRGKNYPKKSDFLQEGYCVFLNTKNVRVDGFEFKTVMFITKDKDNTLGNGKLQRNDVLLTTRGTIGNIAVYDESVPFENIRINSGMLIFRPNTKLIIPEYLFAIFQSGIMKSQTKKFVSGTAQPQLPIKTLINFSIPVPKSTTEQKTIVKKLDELSGQTKKLEEIYRRKLELLEELKKSVLAKAFRGEL